MPVTRRLTAAYNKSMEVILLVLFLMNADDRTKESLKNFLDFYRENRTLIATLAGTAGIAEVAGTAGTPAAEPVQATASAEEKDRPRSEVGDKTILEEYLRRLAG